MAERLDAAAVVLDVVRGPQLPEGLAAQGQLADQAGQGPVVRSASGLGPQAADGGVGDAVPVPVELRGLVVEEDEPGQVGGPPRASGGQGGEYRSIQRVSQRAGGQDVRPPGGQELPDLAADVLHAGHVSEARQAAWWQGGPGSTPHSSISLTPPAGGCLEVSPRCRGGLCARQARPSTTWKESSDVYAYGCQRAPG